MSFINPLRISDPISSATQSRPLAQQQTKTSVNQQTTEIALQKLGEVSLSLGKQEEFPNIIDRGRTPNIGNDQDVNFKTQGIYAWAKGKAGSLIAHPTVVYCLDKALFITQNLDKALQESRKKLSELSGVQEFGQLLEAAAPMILFRIAGDSLAHMNDSPKAFQVLLNKVVVNVAGRMKQDQEYSKAALTPVNVSGFLFKIISTELSCISADLERTSRIENNKDREAAKNKIVAPVVRKLLYMLFPKGASDVPMLPLVRSAVWYVLENQLLPNLLIQLDDSRKFNELSQTNHSEFIAAESHHAARNFIDSMKAILTEDSRSVAVSLVSKSPILQSLDDQTKEGLNQYLTSQIGEFGRTQNSGIWGMIGSTIETLLVHVFSTLSQTRKPEEEASVAIATQMLKTLSVFVKKNKRSIASAQHRLTKKKIKSDQIKNEKVYKDKFLPLAISYQEMMGLTSKGKMIPELLRGLFDMFFLKQLPQLAAANYENMLLPLAELFDAVNDPTSSVKKFQKPAVSKDLFTMCSVLGKLTAKQLPLWLVGQSDNISESIVSNLPQGADDIKAWVRAWINGQLIELIKSKNPTILNLWKFVECTVPQVLAHIITSLTEGESDNRNNVVFLALNTILGRFLGFAKENDKTLKVKYEELKNAGKIPAAEEEFIALFKPFCSSLQKDLGVGGGKQLPVPELLNKSTESQIQKLGPELCAKLYCDFSDFYVHTSDTAVHLKEGAANEGVSKLSMVASEMISEATPKLLHDYSDKIAKGIVDHLCTEAEHAGGLSIAMNKDELRAWVANQIRVLGAGLSSTYPEIWRLLGAGVEMMLGHILFSLSKDNEANAEASILGTARIFQTINSFVREHDKAISERLEKLRVGGVQDPSSDSEYALLFVPLADNLRDLMGLSEFPGMLKEAFASLFTNIAPAQLARSYQKLIVPLSDLFEAIDNPKTVLLWNENEPRLGEARLLSLCQFAGKIVGEDLPKMADDPEKRKEIADQMALTLVKRLANPEQIKLLERRLARKGSSEISPEKIEYSAEPDKFFGLYEWSSKWLNQKIEGLADRQDPKVNKFWNVTQRHLDAFLSYIMSNLARTDDLDKDVLIVAINKILGYCAAFLAEHGSSIDTSYQRLRELNQNLSSDEDFISLFRPLCDSIMKEAGMQKGQNVPLPGLFVDLGQNQLEKLVPELFADLYSRFSQLDEEQERSLKRICQIVNPQNEVQGSLYGDAASAIKNMCSYCSVQIIKTIQEARIPIEVSKGTSEWVKLGQAIPMLKQQPLDKLWDKLQEAVVSILLGLIANRLEGAVSGGKKLDSAVVNDVLSTILKTLFAYSQEERAQIEEAFKIEDSYQQKKKLRQLFSDRASKLFSLLKVHSAENDEVPLALPLPPFLNNLVWTQLEKTILPDFFANVYAEKLAGATKAQENSAAIKEITGNTVRSEACDVIAEFVSQFLPAFTKVDQEAISELLYEVATKKLEESGNPEGISLSEYLKGNQEAIQQELCHAIFDSSSVLKELRPFSKDNIKPILIQAFTRLTERINGLENPARDKDQKEFLLKLGIQLMTITKDHLQTLNKIARDHRKDVFHKVDHDTMIKEFSSLHKAVAHSDKALKNRKMMIEIKQEIHHLRRQLETYKRWGFGYYYKAKIADIQKQIKVRTKALSKAKQLVNNERREIYFGPFSKTMLQLAGLNSADDLPFPSPIKEQVWEQLHNSLMPTVFSSIFDVVLEPNMRNKMIISSLEIYNESIKNPGPKILKEEIPNDPLQDSLNTICGELFQEVVQLIPKSMVKSVFKINKIKSRLARRVGRSIRQQLSQKLTFQKIVDQGIISGLPNFHNSGIWKIEKEPGVWVELEKNQHIAGNIKFFPAKTGRSGKLEELPEMNFAFPVETEELESAAIKKMDEEEATLQQMRNLMVSTTHQAIGDLIKAPFVAFLDLWDEVVNKIFGEYSTTVRSVFRFIGFRIVYKLLEITMEILFFLPKHAFWFFMDWHIASRVDDVIKGLQLDVHENLIYKLCDELVISLKGDLPKESFQSDIAKL